MSNVIEAKSEIQVDIPLTDEAKLKCADEMLNAMKNNLLSRTPRVAELAMAA